MDLYAENILDHYRDPRCKGEGSGASVSKEEDNPSCGDRLTAHLWIEDGSITKIEWEGTGCAISQAGMSIFAEELEGKTTTELLSMKKETVYELLGVPIGPRRFKCALLCLHTVKNAIRKHEGLEPQMWLETVEIDED
ncbi:MAG: iron-sulfur cluster assembly scaffold protein [Candidatus Peribacter sp.]|jgi:nitrogen fixation protein NifU and related proteins|nr:iron-sulfur cluster assembly scaffold protein [Candidatus Peribacter sp.]MBT4393223.1 iron-sulfur cluster assembly scaffold protein [Candidatus Peribacter sp.]MBT4601118.1 iron-sulfur cluster assembly scaffold protein [Candidatus Peribacter sp.]MBT5148922.1 iron-sulfur cluster assembly scaffold protein [Candidatus Peribacter sp.]MBT5637199.1 iron-sulfur cluster assembly scaffold protein [Candidatus Peribacter sp.]